MNEKEQYLSELSDEQRLQSQLQLMEQLIKLYPLVTDNHGKGKNVVFSMISTCFNNTCDIAELPRNNTNSN